MITGKVVALDDRFPKQSQDEVTSFDVTGVMSPVGLPGRRYNPDDLVGRRGLGIYAKMLNDEQVKAVVDFRLAALLARGWDFVFSDTSSLSDDEQQQRIKVCNTIVDRIRGSFSEALENISTGREFGFSMTEKIYSTVNIDGREYVGLSELRLRDPYHFEFHADPFGTLVKTVQRVTGQAPLEIDSARFIHYVHRQKWDQFYGRSELRAAYRWWYVKEQVVTFWPIFLEKFGAGIFVASREDDNAPIPGSPEYESLKSALSNIRALMYLILPRGVKLDVKFPAATTMYADCIQFCDLAIAKSQLVPNLMGVSHTGQTGAYSQSQTQFSAFHWAVNMDANRIQECLNDQLFRDLGDQNWADGDYPRFRFNPASMEHLQWMLSTWRDLLGSKAVIATEEDERYLRSLLSMPERDDDDKPLIDPAAQPSDGASIDGTPIEKAAKAAAQDAAGETDLAALRAEITEIKTLLLARSPTITLTQSAGASSKETRHREAVLGRDIVPHEALRGVPRHAFDRAVERVAFSTIERRTDALAITSVNDLAHLVAQAAHRALGTDDNLRALINEHPADTANVELNRADQATLGRQVRQVLDHAWSLGSNLAASELDRARGEATPVQARRERFDALRDNASAYLDAQSLRISADVSDRTRKILQQALQNAVKFGTPLTEVRAAVWNALVAQGLTTQDQARGAEPDEAVNGALDLLWTDTVEGAASYLDTVIRTNTFEALNEARFAEFTDPDLSDFVQALRYAAVLDSSTTEICRALNDSIWKADSAEWDIYRPPNHWNCRSVLVPITAIDGWDGEESDAPTVEPQAGFK